jgi:plasmid stabilization system protein ParE
MPHVVFGPAAQVELREAADWYSTHLQSVSDRFIAEIEVATERIGDNPLQFPVVFKDVRRARLRRFPYGLYFRIHDDAVYVIACFHSSRSPRRWRERS